MAIEIQTCFLLYRCCLVIRPFVAKKKVVIRDIFVVNRYFFVTIHDTNITNHDMNWSRFSLKKQKHDS